MPLCDIDGVREAEWRVFLLVRLRGKSEPLYYPDRFVCGIHRRTVENVAQAAPQAVRAVIGDRLAQGGFPDPDWDSVQVSFEKVR